MTSSAPHVLTFPTVCLWPRLTPELWASLQPHGDFKRMLKTLPAQLEILPICCKPVLPTSIHLSGTGKPSFHLLTPKASSLPLSHSISERSANISKSDSFNYPSLVQASCCHLSPGRTTAASQSASLLPPLSPPVHSQQNAPVRHREISLPVWSEPSSSFPSPPE